MKTSFGIANVVDELGRLRHAEAPARNLVSAYIANVISDLSVVTEALRQLDMHGGQLIAMPMMDMEEDAGRNINGLTVPWINLLEVIDGSKPTKFCKLGIPTERRFYYPVDKRKTQENHKAMWAAGQNLDAFWRRVDQNLEVQRHGSSTT